jgi:signal transduction histidine kinase
LAGSSAQLCWRAGEATILGDSGRIEQALDNLVLNAIEHGGARIGIEARQSGSEVTISVVDSGPHRAQRPSPGRVGRADRHHGHGLRVVRRIAAEHGGRFELRRSPGRTEALLRLPVCAVATVAA